MGRKKHKKQAKAAKKTRPEPKVQPGVQPVVQNEELPSAPAIERKPGDFQFLKLLALAVLVIVVYANTINAPFQWDEEPLIEQNPIIRDIGYFLEPSRASDLLGYDNFVKRYFSYMTFALNHALHGTSVPGYHIVNISLHIASTLTVFWLGLLLLKTPALRETHLAGRAGVFAFFVSAIYAAHPVQTEAVTYIFQRHALLAALLYMLSIALYMHWRISGKWLWYALCLAAAVLAMKSKANAFTLPAMAVAVEFMFFSGPKARRAAWLVPLVLTMLIVPLTLASLSPGEVPGQTASITETIGHYAAPTEDKASYLFTQFRVIPTYLRLLMFPVGQNLDYDYPEYSSIAAAPVLMSLALLVALALAGAYCLRLGLKRRREFLLVSLGVLWFFVALSIESSFIRLSMVINEYRLYLPSFGMILAAVALAFMGFERATAIRNRRPEAVVLGVLVIVFALASVHRNAQWQSQISLWGDVVEKSPMKTRGMLHLGVALEENGQFQESMSVYDRALEIEPDNDEIYYDMGVVYGKLKQNNKAFGAYRKALELNPANYNAHNNIGALYADKRMDELAIKEFLAAVRLAPDNSKAHNNLSIMYLRAKDYDKALTELLSVLRTAPQNPFVHNKLGVVYYNLGQNDKAIEHYRKALVMLPTEKNANYNLAKLLYEQGKYFEAEGHVAQAVTSDPDNRAFRSLANTIGKAMAQPAR